MTLCYVDAIEEGDSDNTKDLEVHKSNEKTPLNDTICIGTQTSTAVKISSSRSVNNSRTPLHSPLSISKSMKNLKSELSTYQLFMSIWKHILVTWFNYVVTLALFPGVMSLMTNNLLGTHLCVFVCVGDGIMTCSIEYVFSFTSKILLFPRLYCSIVTDT